MYSRCNPGGSSVTVAGGSRLQVWYRTEHWREKMVSWSMDRPAQGVRGLDGVGVSLMEKVDVSQYL